MGICDLFSDSFRKGFNPDECKVGIERPECCSKVIEKCCSKTSCKWKFREYFKHVSIDSVLITKCIEFLLKLRKFAVSPVKIASIQYKSGYNISMTIQLLGS